MLCTTESLRLGDRFGSSGAWALMLFFSQVMHGLRLWWQGTRAQHHVVEPGEYGNLGCSQRQFYAGPVGLGVPPAIASKLSARLHGGAGQRRCRCRNASVP